MRDLTQHSTSQSCSTSAAPFRRAGFLRDQPIPPSTSPACPRDRACSTLLPDGRPRSIPGRQPLQALITSDAPPVRECFTSESQALHRARQHTHPLSAFVDAPNEPSAHMSCQCPKPPPLPRIGLEVGCA
jgi:hypothetical protein